MKVEADTAPLVLLGWRDGAIAIAFFVLFVLLMERSPHHWLWGDGTFLLNRFADGQGFWMHMAYLPAAELVQAAAPDLSPARALRLASTFGAALGLAFSYLIARRVGALALPAAAATALFGLAPAVWFFAIAVEVHGTQFGALSVGVWLTLMAPWRRFCLALPLAALGLMFAYVGHQSAPSLGPGWVLLVAFASARSGRRLSVARCLFLVGPVLLLGLLAADFATQELGQKAVLFGSKSDAVLFAKEHHNAPSFAWWRRDVLEPLGWSLFALLPIVWAVVRGKALRGLEGVSLAVLIGVPGALFAVWAVDNRGGYLAAALPFLIWASARARAGFGRAALPATLGLLVLLIPQALYGWRDVTEFSERFDLARHEQRAAAVRHALPNGGELISFDTDLQNLRQFVGNVREHTWLDQLLEQVRKQVPPEEAALILLADLQRRSDPTQPLLLDTSYRTYLDTPGLESFRTRLLAIEAELARHYTVTPLPPGPEPAPSWPLARLTPR